MNLAWGWWRLSVVYKTLQKGGVFFLLLNVANKFWGGKKGS